MQSFHESPVPPIPPESSLPPKIPPFSDVVVVYILSSIILIVFGGLFQELHLLSGLLITELILIIGPPIVYTWWYRYSFTASFHLAPVSVPVLLLSFLSAITLFVVVGGIAQFQELLFPHSQDYQEAWQQALRQFHAMPFPLTWALIALLPGVCEELLFRGFLLRGFRGRFSDPAAVVWVGILFGIFHVDLYRFVPVTLLGILFGYLVVRTGSIIAGMVAHVTNNTIAISLSYFAMELQEQLPVAPDEISPIQQLWAFLPVLVIAIAGFLVVMRLLLKITNRRRYGMSETEGTHGDSPWG
jgi:membrane protease YdiL (CAAX protease family)